MWFQFDANIIFDFKFLFLDMKTVGQTQTTTVLVNLYILLCFSSVLNTLLLNEEESSSWGSVIDLWSEMKN